MFIYDDNFLTDKEIKYVQDLFDNSENLWKYSPSSLQLDHQNYDTIISFENFSDSPFFSMDVEDNSVLITACKSIIDKFMLKNKIKYNQILRAKFNITPSHSKEIITFPHVDSKNPHYVFLYYVNNSSGNTIIYNEKYGDNNINHMSIMRSISPKEGSAFLIDGSHFHGTSIPTDGSLRKVINANLFSINLMNFGAESEAKK